MKTSMKIGVVAAAMTVAAISANAWIRSDIDNYSLTGIGERYVYGGGCGWWDNNTWDAACNPSSCVSQQSGTEGSDCSDYVPRCYALPSYLCLRSCSGHPYSTYSMYNGWAGNKLLGSEGTTRYTWMHFVIETSISGCTAYGAIHHTGLVRTWDSGGYYTREAHCTTCGIESQYRTFSFMSSTCAHFLLRSNL